MEPNTVAPKSSNKKVVIGIVVIIAIALIAWTFAGSSKSADVSDTSATSTAPVSTTTAR